MTATAKEALLNLRYAFGVAIEIKIALWLLSSCPDAPAAVEGVNNSLLWAAAMKPVNHSEAAPGNRGGEGH